MIGEFQFLFSVCFSLRLFFFFCFWLPNVRRAKTNLIFNFSNMSALVVLCVLLCRTTVCGSKRIACTEHTTQQQRENNNNIILCFPLCSWLVDEHFSWFAEVILGMCNYACFIDLRRISNRLYARILLIEWMQIVFTNSNFRLYSNSSRNTTQMAPLTTTKPRMFTVHTSIRKWI